MVTSVGVTVEEKLSDIGMNSRLAVIHVECDFEEDWLKSLKEEWKTQSVSQWVEWRTRPAPEDEVPNIDWIISVFLGNKKDYGKP